MILGFDTWLLVTSFLYFPEIARSFYLQGPAFSKIPLYKNQHEIYQSNIDNGNDNENNAEIPDATFNDELTTIDNPVNHQNRFFDFDFDDEDQVDDDPCNISDFGLRPQAGKMVMLVSDNTGTFVKSGFQKSLIQFELCDDTYDQFVRNISGPQVAKNANDSSSLGFTASSAERLLSGDTETPESSTEITNNVQTKLYTYIRDESVLASIIRTAQNKNAIIIMTIADNVLRSKAKRMCDLSNVPMVDLLGPTVDALTTFLGKAPTGISGKTSLSDGYYRRIESVEFTLKADDGQSPWLLSDADVIIVGVSRTGKTPLSVVLSQTQGLKVANIPLVKECPPPKELFDEATIDPQRVFCLTISPSELKRIRLTRLETSNVRAAEESLGLMNDANTSNYADRAYIMNDLRNARDLCSEHGWTPIDVTSRAVEETASYIGEVLSKRFDRLYLC
mmetsp:Transcript_46775/g.56211  ORF Transcript_46775/g.56211 Transcript_46775/m.56211 type:complete len:449 (-) Transcript_46775:162-1508(-)